MHIQCLQGLHGILSAEFYERLDDVERPWENVDVMLGSTPLGQRLTRRRRYHPKLAPSYRRPLA